MTTRKEILKFISNFEDGKDMFLHGCCYWFAKILHSRFLYDGKVEIMYNRIDNHFAALINGRLYDASGEIPKDGFIPWADMMNEDVYEWERIIHNCIRFDELDEPIASDAAQAVASPQIVI